MKEKNGIADVLKMEFRNAANLEQIIEVLRKAKGGVHPNCQHYTTLNRLLTKIRDCKWYLTRADCVRLNDLQESRKFGDVAKIPRVWQSSFTVETSESAAMWALYCKESPFALRISLPYDKVIEWVSNEKYLYKVVKGSRSETATKTSSDKDGFESVASPVEVDDIDFHDILYAATDFRDRRKSRLDFERQNSLSWNHTYCKALNVADLVRHSDLTGWVKDYEWRHEAEARIVAITKKIYQPTSGLYLAVPKSLIGCMRFTMSPWLDERDESEVENMIIGGLKSLGISHSGKIHRSTLSGSLNFEIR